MKINRWTAEIAPNKKIIGDLFGSEGLDYKEVVVQSGTKISNQRSTLTEVIQIVDGELIFNLSGTQFVLRVGDRLEMAANTQYSYSNMREEKSSFLSAQKI